MTYKVFIELDDTLVKITDNNNSRNFLESVLAEDFKNKNYRYLNFKLSEDGLKFKDLINDYPVKKLKNIDWEVISTRTRNEEHLFLGLQKKLFCYTNISPDVLSSLSLYKYEQLILSRQTDYLPHQCILIHNDIETIEEWRKCGGVGILHTSFEKTFNELKSITNQW